MSCGLSCQADLIRYGLALLVAEAAGVGLVERVYCLLVVEFYFGCDQSLFSLLRLLLLINFTDIKNEGGFCHERHFDK